MGQTLSPALLLQEMARLRERPPRDHAILLKEVGNYFWETEGYRIDPAFVIQFSPYIHIWARLMISAGVSEEIQQAIIALVGIVNLQCDKINNESRDARYYSDFITLARLLIFVGEKLS
jgi:hypothetical protein